ncbi:MAG TPA: DUF6328 family protein [Ktedonobacterales bacterium]|nr:DUF6328 family protein [Ktedonobacterales bacterium]
MSDEPSVDQRTAASPTDGPTPSRVIWQSQDQVDLTEMLQELRVLIPGVQVLTGFLLILPFDHEFRNLALAEKWVYLAAFVSGITSLILLSAPAAQLRFERPLRDRAHFNEFATRMTIIGLIPLSLALILTTQLIAERTLGATTAIIITACVAVLLAAVWWVWPLMGLRARR